MSARARAIAVLILAAAHASATSWIRDYDLGMNATFGPVAATPDGGLVLVADGQRGLGSWDSSIVRLDPEGRILWHRIRGTGEGDRLLDVRVEPDGSVLVAGMTYWRGPLLEKYLPDGTLAWARRVPLDVPSSSPFAALARAPGGGWLAGTSTTSAEPCVVRVSDTGSVTWAKAYDAGDGEKAVAISSSLGWSLVAVAPRTVMIIQPDGTPAWATRLELDAPACPVSELPIRGLVRTRDGGFLACGGGETCDGDFGWLVKVAADGVVAWERHDTWSPAPDDAWGWGRVAELSDGRVVVQARGVIAVLDEGGAEVWSRQLPEARHDWAFAGGLAVTAGDDIAATWQWSRGLARFDRDGSVNGDPCHPVAADDLPGGLVSPGALVPVAVTARVLSASSQLVVLDEVVQCADPRCAESCAGGELDCVDGIDDDADGATDCDDSDCAVLPICGTEDCANGIDDDADGDPDCADAECAGDPACAPDQDGDGWPDALDCAPLDYLTFAPPVDPVLGVELLPLGVVLLTWQDQGPSAGPSTVQDVVRGELGDLLATQCLASDVAGTSVVDPMAPAGAWYLARASNPCGATSFGPAGDAAACP